ncbi:hypothetical protein WA026_021967 [Henosepilachna vigintioctopunctata]|uniref:Uncharacterized protein n=1 Tax=Henosepilachna vigintioctopunctata TaxID=420089 RepID=A0AAW1VHA0_9CUCU
MILSENLNSNVIKMTKIGENISKFLLIFQYFSFRAVAYGPSINYCLLRCPEVINVEHTVCKRLHRCGPVRGCTEILANENFRSHILHQHNEIRNCIANGSDTGTYRNTGAKNMHVLSYDMELEYIAACSINTCSKQIDLCNDSERFKVSANRAWGKRDNWTEKAVSFFYSRIKFIKDSNQIQSIRLVLRNRNIAIVFFV